MSVIKTSAPIRQRLPIATERAAQIVVPLNPLSSPMDRTAPGLSVRKITGRETPSAVKLGSEHKLTRSPIVIVDSSQREMIGTPYRLISRPTSTPCRLNCMRAQTCHWAFLK